MQGRGALRLVRLSSARRVIPSGSVRTIQGRLTHRSSRRQLIFLVLRASFVQFWRMKYRVIFFKKLIIFCIISLRIFCMSLHMRKHSTSTSRIIS